jgi:hypothetical protein
MNSGLKTISAPFNHSFDRSENQRNLCQIGLVLQNLLKPLKTRLNMRKSLILRLFDAFCC